MRRGLPLVIVLTALVLSSGTVDATRESATEREQKRPATPPAGWRETMDKSLDLTINGKAADVITLWERWVKQHPDYPDGIAMLGGSYENMGLSIRLSGAPDAIAKSAELYEKAATYIRRAVDLKGDGARFDDVRGLIDLYGPLRLNRTAEHVQLARESAARFPTDPYAQAYAICAIAQSGASIDEAVRAAHASVPATADAQSALGGTLLSCARDWRGSDRIAVMLLQQALDFTTRALSIAPSDESAARQKAEILLEQARHKGAFAMFAGLIATPG